MHPARHSGSVGSLACQVSVSRLSDILQRFDPGPIFDLVWPRSCEICHRPAGNSGRYLCWDCLSSFPLIATSFCSQCGDPVDGVTTAPYVCSLCVDRNPSFDVARSATRFKGGIKELLHRFKYSNAVHLDDDLSVLMQACVQTHYPNEYFDAITFVPLHPAKERARTYNQARLLAQRLSDRMKIPLAPGCLRRIRATGTQTRLDMRERAQNMKDAFEVPCPEWIEGRTFLLVDDVMTTGATVNEAARTLKRAGSRRVCVVTVARG